MKPELPILTMAALLSASAPSLTGGEEKPEVPQPGAAAPEVTVKAPDGEARTLREWTGGEPSVVVFYRGGWCPYCTKHLSALAEIDDDLKQMGLRLLAISADRPEKLREKPEYAELSYDLLSDHSMEAAEKFGIAFEVDAGILKKYEEYGIDLEEASGETHHRLPHPAVFVIDGKGIVKFAHVDEDYKVRLEPEEVLAAARKAKTDAD